MSPHFTIEDMKPQDWAQVRSIYAEGLATGLATFSTTPPLWKVWDASHLAFGRLVARSNDSIVAWAALTRVADT